MVGVRVFSMAFVILAAGCTKSPPSRPNILLVTLDTTRADRLGAYGYDQASTPAFDSVASEGVLFERAWSVTPLTTPAHASMMTGLLPPAHGVRNNGRFRLSADATTLAEVLEGAGWSNGAFVAAFPVSRSFGMDQGFQTFDDDLGVDDRGENRSERPCDEVLARALPWLDGRMADPSTPFFAWVHFYDAHDPYAPPSPLAERFRGREYDGEVAFADQCLATLLGALQTGGVAGRTVVAVVGDHGEALGEHGEPTHGLFVYEEVIRVPMVLRAPWVLPKGERRRDLASVIDVAPTLAALAGLPGKIQGHGRDLFAEIPAGASPSDTRELGPGRALYAESFFGQEEFAWAPLVTVRRGDAKWIAAPRPERYDLSSDPGESANLHGIDPERDAGMESLLAEVAGWASTETISAVPGAMDDEMLERLQSLGYIGGGAGSVSTGSALVGRDPKDAIEDYRAYRRGTDLLVAGSGGGALDIFEGLVARDPDNPEFRLRLGMAYAAAGNLAEAEREYRELVARYPDFYLGNRRLSSVLEAQGRWQESLDLWLALRERGVAYVGTANRVARAWLALGRPDRALREVESALEAEGRTADLLLLAGKSLEGMGLPDEALSRYREALEAFPGHPGALDAAARLLRMLGREREVAELYEELRARRRP
jgi:arylsulfatase A-like enzyme